MLLRLTLNTGFRSLKIPPKIPITNTVMHRTP